MPETRLINVPVCRIQVWESNSLKGANSLSFEIGYLGY